jgi:hypothetical protein
MYTVVKKKRLYEGSSGCWLAGFEVFARFAECCLFFWDRHHRCSDPCSGPSSLGRLQPQRKGDLGVAMTRATPEAARWIIL